MKRPIGETTADARVEAFQTRHAFAPLNTGDAKSRSTVPTEGSVGQGIERPKARTDVGDLVGRRDWGHADEARYQVDEEHARGGIGRVLRAHDRDLDRTVALKELIARDEQTEARFIREALITARLQHPSIVPIYEVGRRKTGEPFYAMKLISGSTFAALIRRAKTIAERLALLPHIIAVADAIAFAHGQGIVHRDLKPSNIVIGLFGETVIVDWGLAADLSVSQEPGEPITPYRAAAFGNTIAGTILGTPQYMPPEQAQGKPVDARADVYAIGAILYQLLAGTPPFDGNTSDEILTKVATQQPISIAKRQREVPQELATIVGKAMSRDANERYSTAKGLAEDLKRFQTGQLVSAHDYTRTELVRRWVRRYRVPATISAGFVLLLVILATAAFRRIMRERDRAETARQSAERAQALSENSRIRAEASRNQLVIQQATASLDRDPTIALAWLKSYPENGTNTSLLLDVAAQATSLGVAKHVFRGEVNQISVARACWDIRRM